MSSSLAPVSGSALLRRRLSGVAFLLVLVMLISLSILMYQKAFTRVVKVTLKTDHIGNQLSVMADVKVRGLVVGEVRGVHSTGSGATIDLALQPDKVKLIPENTEAQLLPKTLFGEKYVELVAPAQPAAAHIKAGDVIPQDRSTTAMETSRALDDLLPLLRTLRPAELSLTLNSLSTALRGRGDSLGANLARTAAYLRRVNPEVPTIGADLSGLADLANNTAAAAPALLTTLDNLSASSRNVVEERVALDAFLSKTGVFARTANQIVRDNEGRLTALARDSQPSLDLYAHYSSEFPCFLKGLTVYEPIVEKTFGGLQPGLHITFEAVRDNGGYVPGQEPKYLDSRAPYCDGLPKPKVPAGEASFADGYRRSTTPTASQGLVLHNAALAVAASPVLDVPVDQVPDVVGLLLGPLADGSQGKIQVGLS